MNNQQLRMLLITSNHLYHFLLFCCKVLHSHIWYITIRLLHETVKPLLYYFPGHESIFRRCHKNIIHYRKSRKQVCIHSYILYLFFPEPYGIFSIQFKSPGFIESCPVHNMNQFIQCRYAGTQYYMYLRILDYKFKSPNSGSPLSAI